MSKNKPIEYNGKSIEGEGEIRPFAMLMTGANMFLEKAEEKEDGRTYNLMASMLFCAFAIESYLTHLIQILMEKDWTHFDRLNPKGKLKLLEKSLNLKIDYSNSPFTTFVDIFQYRNKLVHGKTETVDIPTLLYDKKFPVTFEADWEKQTTINTAKRFLKDTRTFIDILFKETGIDKLPPGMSGMSNWTEKVID